jgi:aminoglycoside phosphotransferase (APT) family kinase protein
MVTAMGRDTREVPELDLNDLSARLAPVGVTGLRPLVGGASSLTYAGELDGERVVVKVAPPGVPPTLNRDVLRQARVLHALGANHVPVPRVLLEDGGAPPEVPPLFVMSFLEGTSLEPLYDLDHEDEDPAVVGARMRDAAGAMARLHAVDPGAVGDEPVVGLDQEVERWCRVLETVDPALAPGWSTVADELRAAIPAPVPPAIVHGDFRLGNLLAVGPKVTAIIDWEIWAVGDPRVDLGWFLICADPDTYRRPTAYVGRLPTPDELTQVYGEVADRAWFEAQACFKSVAVWALIVKHNRRRSSPDADVESMAASLPHLLEKARAFLA